MVNLPGDWKYYMKVLYFMNHVDQGGAALALYDLIFEIKKQPQITPVVITGKKMI